MTALEDAVRHATTIATGAYTFKKYSFGEEGTELRAELIQEVRRGLNALCDEFNSDCIAATEPGGHLWGLLVAAYANKPLRIIRTKGTAESTHELIRIQRTGYTTRNLTFGGFTSGERLLLVEDVISTGNTAKTVVDTVRSIGSEVVGIISIVRKNQDHLDALRIPIRSLYIDES